MAINLNNFVSVSVNLGQPSISDRNTSVICILTKETPIYPINKYAIYVDSDSAVKDWGYDSVTAQMVQAIFNQSINILLGGGYVVVVPMLTSTSVPATYGTLTCEKLIFDNFKNVTDGSFNIAVDGGAASNITSLDFSNAENLDDVATIIQTAFTDGSIGATVVANEDSLIFVSNTSGSSSNIVISSNTTGTDLSTLNYFNIAKAISVNGQNAYSGIERLQEAYARTNEMIFAETFLTAYNPTNDEILATASAIQSKVQMLMVSLANASSAITLSNTLVDKGYSKTRCLFHSSENLLFAAAYCGAYQGVNWDGGTMRNLHGKGLTGISSDTAINDTSLKQLNNAGVDCYPQVQGVGAVFCSGANQWFDNILGSNWLQIQLENAGFNAIRNTEGKITQTPTGVDILRDVYKRVLNKAVDINFLGTGNEWTSTTYFGDKDLLKKNIKETGFYIYFTPLNQQSQSSREDRDAPYCQMAGKLAGAINSSNIMITVNQ